MAVFEKYMGALEALKREFTQAGQLDEAILVREEMQRARNYPDVTAAQFVLADQPGAAPVAVAVSKETPAARSTMTRVADLHRQVDSQGGFDGDWQRTTITVQSGDVVTVRASGAWRGKGFSSTCGPEGIVGGGEVRMWGAPYGALLMRVGNEAMAVGAGTNFVAASGGLLSFDVNVRPGKDSRRGCSGALQVRVLVDRHSDSVETGGGTSR